MFFILIASLFALISSPTAVLANECKGANRLSCKDLFTAERCGVLGDCVKIWKTSLWQKYREDTSSKCSFCRSLSENLPVSKIGPLCSVLQLPEFNQCERAIEQLRLTLGFSDSQRIEKKRDITILCNTLTACETDLYIGGLDFGTITCEECKNLMRSVQQLINDNASEDIILKFLIGVFCGRLNGSWKNYCEKSVEIHVQAILNLVKMHTDSDHSCSILKLCHGPVESTMTMDQLIDSRIFIPQNEHTRLPNNAAVGKSSYTVTSHGPFQFFGYTATSACEACVFVLNKIKQSLTNQEYRNEIKERLQEYVCNPLIYMREACTETLRNNFDNFVREINNIGPANVCNALKVCDTKTIPRTENVLYMNSQASGHVTGVCQLCWIAIENIKERTVDRSSREHIHALLNEFCQLVPSYYRKRCERFVEKFGPLIVDDISKDTNANLVCQSIGACAESSVLGLLTGFSETTGPTEANYCNKCKTIVDMAHRQLVQSSTEQVRIWAEQICSVLPGYYASECNELVNDHADAVPQYLQRGFTSEQICEQIGFCPEDAGRQKTLCLRGPLYWCSSRETADRCDATSVCPVRWFNQTFTHALCDPRVQRQICSGHGMAPVCSILTTSVCGNQQPINLLQWPTSVFRFPQIWSTTTGSSSTGTLDRPNCTICVDVLNRWSDSQRLTRVPLVSLQMCNKYPSFSDRVQCDRVWAQRHGAFRQILTTDAKPETVCMMNLCQVPTVSAVSPCVPNPLYVFSSPRAGDQCSTVNLWRSTQQIRPQSSTNTVIIPNTPACEGGPSVFCQTFNTAQRCGEDAVRFCQDHFWFGSRPRIVFQSDTL
ncbi:hypothetical protein D915_009287 [Fasciola hepatica]|uniref:Proactivator polypeptide n=1 Tax=Fasciola hepatica TaxID=6192 RepID=A0A4E0RE59_FASHE|nr:hypothetical protein D915_009287 [Fasciola hepatica]